MLSVLMAKIKFVRNVSIRNGQTLLMASASVLTQSMRNPTILVFAMIALLKDVLPAPILRQNAIDARIV